MAALAAGVVWGAATRVEFVPVQRSAAGRPARRAPVPTRTAVEARPIAITHSITFDAALQHMVADATSEVVVKGVSTVHYAAVPVTHIEDGDVPQVAGVAFVPRYRLRGVDYRQALPGAPELLRTSGAR